MKMKIWGIVLGVLFPFVLAAPGWADSLWSDRSESLYINKQRPFHVGDLLTISIVEKATATQTANTSNSKSGEITGDAGTGLLSVIPKVGAGWESSTDGTGSTKRGGTLTAKITVSVKELMPNGILKLEGVQQIKVNKETQTIRISGLARAEDVSADNIVLSTCIADARIEYEGTGTVSETQNSGLLTKIFHWLF